MEQRKEAPGLFHRQPDGPDDVFLLDDMLCRPEC
jgi:hypothetical protein